MNLAEMKQQFDAIRPDVLAALETVQTLKEVEQIRVQQLGKKGPITEVLKNNGFNIICNLIPGYFKIPVMCNTIFQIKIYKGLIWYACALGFFFEISDYTFILFRILDISTYY